MATQLAHLSGNHYLEFDLAALAAGAAEALIGVVPFNARVQRVQWVPSAAVVANAVNFTTLNVRNRGQAGGGATVAASRSYAATNSVALVPEDMTLAATPTDRDLTAGDVLTIDKTIAGTGLATPAGKVVVYFTSRGI